MTPVMYSMGFSAMADLDGVTAICVTLPKMHAFAQPNLKKCSNTKSSIFYVITCNTTVLLIESN